MIELSSTQLAVTGFVLLVFSWWVLIYSFVLYLSKVFKDPKLVNNKTLFPTNKYFIGLLVAGFIFLAYVKGYTEYDVSLVHHEGYVLICALAVYTIGNRLIYLPEDHTNYIRSAKRLYITNALNMWLLSSVPAGVVFLGLMFS